MPHFTLQIVAQGPILTAVVAVSEQRAGALSSLNIPIPQPIPIRALVDTGASGTCIDPSVLRALALTPTGNTQVTTPTTGNVPVDVDQYDVAIIIPPAGGNQIPFVLGTIPVICTELLQIQGYHALIGRDILAHCIFSYNGSMGLFTLAY